MYIYIYIYIALALALSSSRIDTRSLSLAPSVLADAHPPIRQIPNSPSGVDSCRCFTPFTRTTTDS